jgi:hypothetical protein
MMNVLTFASAWWCANFGWCYWCSSLFTVLDVGASGLRLEGSDLEVAVISHYGDKEYI